METLREALARLEKRGFDRAFRATEDGSLEVAGRPPLAPETLVVEEVARFEGQSDPEDEAVLFALRSRDARLRGTFVASYGTQMDPASAAVIHRLDRETGPRPDSSRDGMRHSRGRPVGSPPSDRSTR